MLRLVDYVRTYRTLARQLATPALAGQWRNLGVAPETAARWANVGYLPAEAAELIVDGVTLELVLDVEAALGEGDELAALTLDLLLNEDGGQ